MRESLARTTGLLVTVGYAVLIAWLFLSQPRTVTQAVGGLSAQIGVYAIDEQAFADGLAFFRQDQFVEARAAFARADRAARDPRTQFYIAYSYYRQGWGRTYNDDELFAKGLAAVDHAMTIAPTGRIVVDDDNLQMRSADELKAELEAGLTREASDFNPLRVFRSRK